MKWYLAIVAAGLVWSALAFSQATIVQTEPGAGVGAVSFQTLSDQQLALEESKRQYLAAGGWAYNCDNPGSLWMWAKAFNGKEYRLSLEDAVFIQQKTEAGL